MDYRKKFIVGPGEVRLSKIDPSYTGKHKSHEKALPEIQKNVERSCNTFSTRMGINLSWSCCRHSTPPARTALFATCLAV